MAADKAKSGEPVSAKRRVQVRAKHEPQKDEVQLAMSQIVVDESEGKNDHEQVKARRCPTVREEERGGRVKNRYDDDDVDDEPQHLARELRKHRERKERERHDRRVQVAVGILEPIDRLAGDGARRGAVVHLEVAHAVRDVACRVDDEQQREHDLHAPPPRERLGASGPIEQ